MTIPGQSMSTHANPRQPMPIHVPIAGQFFTKKGKFVNCPIWANPSKSNANPCQSNANFRPFTWAIPALKLGTSPLYGMVPSLLGGQKFVPQHQIGSNPGPILATIQNQSDPFFCHLKPIRCQSDAIQRSTFWSNINSPISKTWSIQCQSANPVPIGQSNANPVSFTRTFV